MSGTQRCGNSFLRVPEAPYCSNCWERRTLHSWSAKGCELRTQRFYLESEFGLPPIGDPSPRPPVPQPPRFPPRPDEPQLPPPDPEPELPGFPEPGEKIDLRPSIHTSATRGCAYFRRARSLISSRILHRTLLTLNYLVNV
jgi:hypothetical protein